jgi:hypothetical protein
MHHCTFLLRAICEMRFVEDSEQYIKERERRLNQVWLVYVGAVRTPVAARNPSPPVMISSAGEATDRSKRGRGGGGAAPGMGGSGRPGSARRRRESKDEFFQRLWDDMDRRNRCGGGLM